MSIPFRKGMWKPVQFSYAADVRKVVIVGPPLVQILDVTGPLEVSSNAPHYETQPANPGPERNFLRPHDISERDIARVWTAITLQTTPRIPHFKEAILQAFYDGINHKPKTTFGNVKADVLADKDPTSAAATSASLIRNSPWREIAKGSL